MLIMRHYQLGERQAILAGAQCIDSIVVITLPKPVNHLLAMLIMRFALLKVNCAGTGKRALVLICVHPYYRDTGRPVVLIFALPSMVIAPVLCVIHGILALDHAHSEIEIIGKFKVFFIN